MKNIILTNSSEIVTCSGFKMKKGSAMNDVALVKDASIVIEDGIIKDIISNNDLENKYDLKAYELIDCSGKSILPGFIDSHTHFIFGGYRADEFSWRLRGDSYMSIMERGGGIANSVNSTKTATVNELVNLGKKRLDSMVTFGVTTVEGKSGYGLEKDVEIKQLEVMKKLQGMHSVDIISTFLGAHSVPKKYKSNPEEFIDYLIDNVLDEVVDKNLAEFCDIFCEKNVFSVEESRKLLLKAKEKGLKLKIHADEIVQLGGAELAAEVGATSADHLLQASDKGIKLMAENDVVSTLLPCTAYSLKEDFARGRYMIDNGCAVALATDFNPGSCFCESIPLVISLATLKMNMTIEETITALTINAAAALGRADKIGSIDIGKEADIVIHEFPSYNFIPYHIGVSTVEKVIKKGKLIYDKNWLKIL
ncbi:imidazolonepropionase [Helicovermis profundi]|uniref:Imidazolonepropionase n=1 Tax=Helicovermis profundi TaxID=3065157 RepID=A0AAU9EV20_9FIRM|nr:imidazolonepropionase [Clostridia bacterium S502]